MIRRFQMICSESAAAALSREECHNILQDVLPLAEQRDRAIHEGLIFAFDLHGQSWKVVLDLRQGWAKFLREDEFEKGMEAAILAN
jgi:hypothetical protein